MLKKTTKELLLQDLIDTKQMLIDAFDDKDVPFIKGGAIDQFFTSKALEFQRNVIFYNSTNFGALAENEENQSGILPIENIAMDLTDIK